MVEGGGFEPPKLSRQIYSLIPLATREPLRKGAHSLDLHPLCQHCRLGNSACQADGGFRSNNVLQAQPPNQRQCRQRLTATAVAPNPKINLENGLWHVENRLACEPMAHKKLFEGEMELARGIEPPTG